MLIKGRTMANEKSVMADDKTRTSYFCDGNYMECGDDNHRGGASGRVLERSHCNLTLPVP